MNNITINQISNNFQGLKGSSTTEAPILDTIVPQQRNYTLTTLLTMTVKKMGHKLAITLKDWLESNKTCQMRRYKPDIKKEIALFFWNDQIVDENSSSSKQITGGVGLLL